MPALLLILLASISGRGQESTPVIRVNSFSSFIWNGPVCHMGDIGPICGTTPDYNGPATSTLVEDPLTGQKIHKLAYEDVEVGSYLTYSMTVGFSKVREYFVANITIVNSTANPVDVSEANTTLPVPSDKDFAKRNVGFCPYIWSDPKKPVPVANGIVAPHASRQFSILMTSEATDTNMQRWTAESDVYSVASMRYAIKVNGNSFVFPWLIPTGTSSVTHKEGKCYSVPEWTH